MIPEQLDHPHQEEEVARDEASDSRDGVAVSEADGPDVGRVQLVGVLEEHREGSGDEELG